eukprot:3622250-Rhodomonas_salina.1
MLRARTRSVLAKRRQQLTMSDTKKSGAIGSVDRWRSPYNCSTAPLRQYHVSSTTTVQENCTICVGHTSEAATPTCPIARSNRTSLRAPYSCLSTRQRIGVRRTLRGDVTSPVQRGGSSAHSMSPALSVGGKAEPGSAVRAG